LLTRRTLLALLAGLVLSAPAHVALAKKDKGPGGSNHGGKDDIDDNDDGGSDNNVDTDTDGTDDGTDTATGTDDGATDDAGVDTSVSTDNTSTDDGGIDTSVSTDNTSTDFSGDNRGGNNKGGNNDGRSRGKKQVDVEWSQDRVLKERQLGRLIPLKTALRIVDGKVRGRVIDVDLMVRSGKPQYRVKVRRTDGVIRTVRLDARSGKVIGLLGF
jgi:uncharacterized membrane protein YkoI